MELRAVLFRGTSARQRRDRRTLLLRTDARKFRIVAPDFSSRPPLFSSGRCADIFNLPGNSY
jgi:hypothetical protein